MNSPVQKQNPTSPGNRQALQNASRRAERQGIPIISAQTLREAIGSATSRRNFVHLLAEKDIETEFQTRGKAEEIYGYKVKIKGTKVWISASTLGKDLSWPRIAHRFKNDDLEVLAPISTVIHRKSNMPQMLEPFMASTHGIHEAHTHAANQAEVVYADSSTLRLSSIQNFQIGELNRVMAMLGFAFIHTALNVLTAILNLIAAILRRFGFSMQAAKTQPVSNQNHRIPLFYSPTVETTTTLPAATAEHKVASELLRVVDAVVNNSPDDLPVVEGTEQERKLAVAALTSEDPVKGTAVAVDADVPRNSTYMATAHTKIDQIQVLKTAIAAHNTASKELQYAELKKGPVHHYADKEIAIELRAVRDKLNDKREKFDKFFIDFPIKSRFPSNEKTKLLADVENLEMSEKNLIRALKEAMDENARIEKVYAAIPSPIVPPAVASLELETRQAVHNARSTIQFDVLELIKSIKGDPHQTQYLSEILAVNEKKIIESWKSFEKDRAIRFENLDALKFQINELQRLKNMQAAAEDAAKFQQDGSYPKPKVDGQIQK